MSNNEQSIVTTRSGVFNPYPPQELLEVTLNLFGRTTEAQNVIYNLARLHRPVHSTLTTV